MVIVADSLEDLIAKYRNTPNPITGNKPLFKDLTDQIIWDSAFEAGKNLLMKGVPLKCAPCEYLMTPKPGGCMRGSGFDKYCIHNETKTEERAVLNHTTNDCVASVVPRVGQTSHNLDVGCNLPARQRPIVGHKDRRKNERS